MVEPACDVYRVSASTFDEAYCQLLSRVLDQGRYVTGGTSLSIGSDRNTYELLDCSVKITSPRRVLLRNSARRFNLPSAIARFCWMMAGNQRMADIAFYEPGVKYFTDDGVIVPGSNYGKRMLNPENDINQLDAVIQRIRADAHTRRAAISIYQPFDSLRQSRDIPCVLGMCYNLRDGKLYASTLMRSMNAYRIFPYNILEFTLLAEIVACEVGAELASMTFTVVSAHIFEDDVEKARSVIAGHSPAGLDEQPVLDPMPGQPSPLEQIQKLVALESNLRSADPAMQAGRIADWIHKASGDQPDKGRFELHPYWKQFYYILLYFVVRDKLNRENGGAPDPNHDLEKIGQLIAPPWSYYLTQACPGADGSGRPATGLHVHRTLSGEVG